MRKGHGSTKVPGVKLRPAAPTKSRKSGASSKQPAWAQPADPDDVDSSDILKSCKKPFVGLVVCASGVSDKANLFQQVVQLGAQTSSDLTDRVTHLICESPGSAKYDYCVEHGIPIMQPSWITDAYGKWLSGESIDVMKSTSIHRFPIFKGVRLCLTAINDVQRRKQIRKQVEKNGGIFIDALGKDSKLTHLLCGPDRSGNADEKGVTSKMQFVEKANRTSADKAHLVWEDWFWDCLEFKGLLREKDYMASGPRPQRRIMREASPLSTPITSTADPHQQRSTATSSALDANPDTEEVANVKRVPEATARLWEGMLKRRGFEMKSGKLTRSQSKTHTLSSVTAENSLKSPSLSPERRVEKETSRVSSSRTESSLNAACKRTKSFAAKAADPEVPKSALQRVRSTPAAMLKRPSSSSAFASSLAPRKEDCHIPEGEQSLFVGLKFKALGEASGPKLTEALELRGGTVLTGPGNEVDVIIVRLAGGNAFYHNERDEAERAKFRTECWIEQCMFEERICASDEHPAFVPLRIPTPIPGADKLVLHTSGLTPSEKTPSVRLIKAIGATVTDQLSRRNTHLLCPCGSGPKFNKAQEWRIPVLNLQWLYSIVRTGEIQSVSDYLVLPATPVEGVSEGGMMADITNSEFVQGSSKGKASGKSSDRSQPSSCSSGAALTSRTEAEPSLSNLWTDSALLSESAPHHPPTSSPVLSSHSPGTRPSTPSPKRRRTATETVMSEAPAISPFASPTKPRKATKSDLGRVPSSATPSPLKMPPRATRVSEREGTTVSSSPGTATTLSGESASVLKDAIASLLGKRSSSDDHETKSQAKSHGPSTRASKRSKPPPRTKSKQDGSARPFSRTTSIETLGRTGSTLSGTGSGYPFEFATGPGSGGDFAESPAGLGGPGMGPDAAGAADESMRVTYEDPSQRAEKRRLLSLIAGNSMDTDADEEDVSKYEEKTAAEEVQEEKKMPQPQPRRRGKNLVRRASTRIAEQC